MTEKQKSMIRQMRLDGCGYRQIATKLELSLSAVMSYCRYYGLTGFEKSSDRHREKEKSILLG